MSVWSWGFRVRVPGDMLPIVSVAPELDVAHCVVAPDPIVGVVLPLVKVRVSCALPVVDDAVRLLVGVVLMLKMMALMVWASVFGFSSLFVMTTTIWFVDVVNCAVALTGWAPVKPGVPEIW